MAQLPHISRHPSTNLTKICHIDQSYPKTEGRTTRKDIRVVPRQEAKPPGKTSELSFLGHRWRNCLLSWDSSDGLINHPGENAARFRFPSTRARASAQNAHPDSLHWDHRPGETQRGDNGETKGREKGGNQNKEQNEK